MTFRAIQATETYSVIFFFDRNWFYTDDAEIIKFFVWLFTKFGGLFVIINQYFYYDQSCSFFFKYH